MLTVEKHNIFNFWDLEKQNQFLNEVLHRIFRELLRERNIKISCFDWLKVQIFSNFFQ